uniref:Putative conserved secreted protein n=1 Tax=Rhipicephalus microplus TaxID=6941 RepID=A0A6M2CIM7_RHIMP
MFLVWVLVACLNTTCSNTPARTKEPLWPAGQTQAQRPLGDCLPTSELQALCQRCAMITRNAKAFRMCCTNDPGNSTESGRIYCKRLLEHTVGSVADRIPNRTVTPYL